ncbi:hypothetical protein H8F24_16445 [Synechococcus sp. CBW1002]|uniref:hypothetical protein n=1 Tax=unclassified Synechococcus TaxID=2626047 RepID=UPI0018CCCAFB|nr:MULTISPECIES: hypothetical protein [unclassified Synechococcus]QPN59561.1 hypothetical protein H8F24_16445 [Synechococcus sp. CBW1002]QPN66381.1 hypothetical protein H8F26_16715 [Synechococcus sp. CBW1006]
MDSLTIFGVAAVAVMLIAYIQEESAAGWILVFAAGCLASGIYGLLAGVWPFMVAEMLWSVVAYRRWRRRRIRDRSAAIEAGSLEPAHKGQSEESLKMPPLQPTAPQRRRWQACHEARNVRRIQGLIRMNSDHDRQDQGQGSLCRHRSGHP